MRNWLRPQGLFPLFHWSLTDGPASATSVLWGGPRRSTPTPTSPTGWLLASHRGARRLGGAGRADRFALLAVLAGVVLALGAVQTLEARLTDLLRQQTAARAAD